MVREKLLLPCTTYPDIGGQNYYRLCMAGITSKGELRRVFPIFIQHYEKNIDLFKKFHWIEYERKEKGDYRKESYKIDFHQIKLIRFENLGKIINFIESRLTNLEFLDNLKDQENTSLGFIKPNIENVLIEASEERIAKKKRLSSQLTLFGGNLGDNYVPYFVRFRFFCQNSTDCSGHSIICEDINFWNFFKKEIEDKSSFDLIKKKFNEQYLESLLDNDLIFMMGTHFLFKTWIIISIISPNLFK